MQRLMRDRSLARFVRGMLITSVLACAGAISGSAFASKSYGYILITAGYLDGCQACHADEALEGGLGTATKPFAQTMKSFGLSGGDKVDVLYDILDYKIQDYDTDCDGVIDVDELTKNGDPNNPAVVPQGYTPMPNVGCNETGTAASTSGASTAPTSATGSTTGSPSSQADASEPNSADSGCAVSAPGAGKARVGALVALLLGAMLARRRSQHLRASHA